MPTTNQTVMGFAQQLDEDEEEDALMSALKRAVRDHLGPAAAAGICGCFEQDLANALSGRKGRHFRLVWATKIARRCDEKYARPIVDAFNRAMGWEGARPIVSKTEGEILTALEQRLIAKWGEAGREMVEENRRAAR